MTDDLIERLNQAANAQCLAGGTVIHVARGHLVAAIAGLTKAAARIAALEAELAGLKRPVGEWLVGQAASEYATHVADGFCDGDAMRYVISAIAPALIAQGVAQECERAAKVCEAERVDADATEDEGDRIYNRACEDCAAAIRAGAAP